MIRYFRRHFFTAFILAAVSASSAPGPRQTISLDGVWRIAEGSLDLVPDAFDRTVPVPGLVDLARPPFVEPGPKVSDRKQFPQKDPRRDAFWYRRTFQVPGPVPPVAVLKIGKAMFGARVILNGIAVGDHAPCFTPGYFDVKAALRSGENDLIVRVGADRDAVTAAVPSGFDYEKDRYIPGIFDSVELILAGTPYIENVQVAPDLASRRARVRVWLEAASAGALTAEVREAKSGRVAGRASATVAAAPRQTLDLAVPLPGFRPWSPEDPFLYELIVRTDGDEFATRFGMREFRFDPATGRAMLNGKPYIMRGSNMTVYRFFEDPERGDLPWNEAWVRLLHQRVKEMRWNSLRYCIGFPPEIWYRVADEAGILIQDEFPLWHGGKGWSTWPKELKADQLAKEYAEWMRERWNHPCVVVWDANNETLSDETAPAIRQVRALDLSSRPWDNSYMPPAEPGDVLEVHPYHFSKPEFKLSQLANADPARWGERGKSGVIINEYGWLWLNRDGTPTTLTEKLYANLLGPSSTTEQRRRLYARYLAAETEFWRAHRTAAAVLHFTALGYSRPDGQTSDHWLDVRTLTWEPEFYRHVRDAFAPVGVMLEAWAEDYPAGRRQDFPVVVVNDRPDAWRGVVRFRILKDEAVVAEQMRPADVAALGVARLVFAAEIPAQPGLHQAEAALLDTPAGPVRSLRDFQVRAAPAASGQEIHVAITGNDSGTGAASSPLRTIQRAADRAQPGDVITVHAGVYRESIRPPRGGESDARRIVYRAAPGEKAEIKGSEVVTNWTRIQGDVWKTEIPNSIFGSFNPYSDLIRGDWFNARGREHHTGAVYLDGEWLDEAATLDEVLNPAAPAPLWFGRAGADATAIWARFPGADPTRRLVEINVRRTVFYPDKPGRNYITVRGFAMRHAATPWAPPTAEQPGLIGTHWSKGWIIESNIVSHSRCVGISLGKHGDQWDNTSANSAEGYVKTIERGLSNGWSRATIGHHVVRNNSISHCEQAGIVGSLGAVFSRITGNVIHDIHVRRLFSGAEMAGIKIHAAIDCEISGNRIFRTCRGLWMDWMAQGTRITRNLCYDNASEDLFVEVNHGPYLVDNNLFLSGVSLLDMSQGGAFAHNLWTGRIVSTEEPGRLTPYHPPHETAMAGLRSIQGGDNRYYNNIFVGIGDVPIQPPGANDPHRRVSGCGLAVYDSRALPTQAAGNIYLHGAKPHAQETNALVLDRTNPGVQVVDEGDRVFLRLTAIPEVRAASAGLVTTERLGKALVSGARYENADGSPLAVDVDYRGARRDRARPAPGPFESLGTGSLDIRVW
ncbi:MAG TPA: right-handed parallel beta-helix repeat-containing protein [Candidatus Paceibacterota bacterium]|nr:right-handed parallel beta-helix repeat-containing protein [Verrucomicrobiota bacterium]HRZ43891.1 right-handed parallel beta-helix repeat-containing protein [Candidatus Paceibacterota bacterium]HRZ92066.1 right-handed parallel beta-helix repeat-containing protein [Candidatus Paceibacterota bacterium]